MHIANILLLMIYIHLSQIANGVGIFAIKMPKAPYFLGGFKEILNPLSVEIARQVVSVMAV